ncbi:hypothetical protein PVK06_042526 [Gossypium arboreum]|uniref:Uncharacterized protein n=1 Tax=Gossypium arboreum TaxID=29729 RepID=A0ABR0ML59_GOSAR|nr:hypothetical protein PVK06_042526 [Gossypium arboreum]
MDVDSLVSNSRPRATIGGVGYRQVEIESDNSLLIVVIQNELAANNSYNKVRLIQGKCLKDWKVKF